MSEGELVEFKSRRDIQFLKMLIDRYDELGLPRGGGMTKSHRYFAWLVDGFICAVAWLHEPGIFEPLFRKYHVTTKRSYVVRRICSTCPGQHLVEFLKAICEKLREEGKEAIITLATYPHSGATFKKAGFKFLGKTAREGHKVFLKKLQ